MRLLERRSMPAGPTSVVLAFVLVASAAVIALMAQNLTGQRAWLFVAEVVVAVLGVLFVFRWRWGAFAILLFLPVQGFVANLLYPDTAALLLNDTLIAATYLGFLAAVNRGEQRWSVPREFVWAFLLLAALCVAQTFNPQLTSKLVALVGFRVLLFYIPLFVIGLSIAQRSPFIIDRLVWLVLLTSLPVNLFGIWEWFQGPHVVSMLGPAFQRSLWIIGTEATDLVIFRPSSTFAFTGHYGEYMVFITIVAFGALHAARRPLQIALLSLIFGTAVVAVILTAGRTAWFLLPVAAVGMYVLRGRMARIPPALPLAAVGLVIAVAVGLPLLRSRLPVLAKWDYLLGHLNNFNPFRPAFFTWEGLIGHGTGSALGAIRYVNGGIVPLQFESSWFGPVYMFGVLGLVAYVFLYGVTLRRAWFGMRAMTGERRWLGAAIFCYLVLLPATEGAINVPPANVFFWLFAGLLAGQVVAKVTSTSTPTPALYPTKSSTSRGPLKRATSPASGEGNSSKLSGEAVTSATPPPALRATSPASGEGARSEASGEGNSSEASGEGASSEASGEEINTAPAPVVKRVRKKKAATVPTTGEADLEASRK